MWLGWNRRYHPKLAVNVICPEREFIVGRSVGMRHQRVTDGRARRWNRLLTHCRRRYLLWNHDRTFIARRHRPPAARTAAEQQGQTAAGHAQNRRKLVPPRMLSGNPILIGRTIQIRHHGQTMAKSAPVLLLGGTPVGRYPRRHPFGFMVQGVVVFISTPLVK